MEDKTTFKDSLLNVKEFFATFKEALIVMVFLCLIIFPSGIKSLLSNLGITQISMAGMTAQIDKQDQKTKATANEADSLHRQIASLTDKRRRKLKDTQDREVFEDLTLKANNLLCNLLLLSIL